MYLRLHLRFLLGLRPSPLVLPSLLSHPVETMAGPSKENSNPFTVASIAGYAVDASTQIFFWWTWRESNPRPECLHFEGITTIPFRGLIGTQQQLLLFQ